MGWPAWLAGCGGGPADAGGAPMLRRAMHFELGAAADATTPGEAYRLHVGGRHYTLQPHDAASRQALQPRSAAASHYALDVELPADRVMHVYVTQRTDHGGRIRAAHGAAADHGLVVTAIHVPPADARRQRAGAASVGATPPRRDRRADLTVDNLDSVGPGTIAQAIVFHHGNLMTRDPDLAAQVMVHIAQAEGLSDLEAAIRSAGQHQWYTMQALLDDDGTPVLRSDGSAVVQYDVRPDVMQAAQRAIANALNAVANDPALKGLLHAVDAQPLASPAPSAQALSNAAGRRRRLDATSTQGLTYTLATDGRHGGLDVEIDAVDGAEVTLLFRSRYLRHLAVYLEFLDADGQPVPVDASDAWSDDNADAAPPAGASRVSNRRRLMVLFPPTLFLGGPLTAGEARGTFRMPSAASAVRIRAGGLGNGGERDAEIELVGVALTATFNIGLPGLLLASSAAMHSDIRLNQVYRAALLGTVVDLFLAKVWGASGASAAAVMQSAATFMASLMISKGMQTLIALIIEEEVESAVLDGIPFIGWALNAVAITTTAAQLAQTSAEVASSPWIIDNRLTVTHDVAVTVNRPQDDFEFPATATHYEVALSFSHAAPVVQRIALPDTTVSEPQTVVFKGVPAGGLVDVAVAFYSDTDWVAGQCSRSGIRNRNDSSAAGSMLTIELTLVENLVPLSTDTRYHHKERLVPTATGLAWQAGPAPVATLNTLSSAVRAGSLASLVGASLNQTLGRLSYSWQSHGGPLQQCNSSATQVLGYAHRTIGLGSNPDDGSKFSGCYAGRPTLVENALFTDEAGVGGNLLIEPTALGGSKVSGFALDLSTGYLTRGVLGVFPIPPDQVRRFANGVLVGISRAYQKLFCLRLAGQPGTEDDAPQATLLGGPAFSAEAVAANPALLLSPVTMAVGLQDTLILLEVDPARPGEGGSLRAFNANGVPIDYFAPGGATTNSHLLSLPTSSRALSYHAMQIDLKGYVFVLSHEGDGAVPDDYRLDLFDPKGNALSTTRGMAAQQFCLDAWRNVYSLNYESFTGPDGDTEPSVSQWIPSTPKP